MWVIIRTVRDADAAAKVAEPMYTLASVPNWSLVILKPAGEMSPAPGERVPG